MHYDDCIKYIYSFINVQNTQGDTPEERLATNLIRTQTILDAMGYKQTFKVAHITGTKGKGSTTFILSKMLMASGYNVGRILSPHIIDFRERMTINDKWIDKAQVVGITTSIKSVIENLALTPTAFEIMTVMSLYYFYINDVDYACVEVGLGGTYDSTNIVAPSVCIITSISYDHTDRLGNTLESISSEKAGIIKHNIPCISAYQDKSVATVIEQACQKNHSNAYFYQEHFSSQIVDNSIDILNFTYIEYDESSKTNTPNFVCREYDENININYSLNIRSSIVGSYQAENISLAMFAYRLLLGGNRDEHTTNILSTLSNLKFDGRFSILSEQTNDSPCIVVDGAHNAYSIDCLLSNATKYFENDIVLFFTPLSDKDIDGMCASIKHYESRIDKIIIASSTFFAGLKESDSKKIYAKMNGYGFSVDIESFDNFDSAINYAIEYAKNEKLPLLITGSLYTVSSSITIVGRV